MYIKYELIGDRTLLYLPPGKPWSLQFRMFDEDGNEDYSVYLTVDGSEPIPIHPGDTISVARSAHFTELILVEDRNFYDIVDTKFVHNRG